MWYHCGRKGRGLLALTSVLLCAACAATKPPTEQDAAEARSRWACNETGPVFPPLAWPTYRDFGTAVRESEPAGPPNDTYQRAELVVRGVDWTDTSEVERALESVHILVGAASHHTAEERWWFDETTLIEARILAALRRRTEACALFAPIWRNAVNGGPVHPRIGDATANVLEPACMDDALPFLATFQPVFQHAVTCWGPPGFRDDMLFLAGRYAIRLGRYDEALDWFEEIDRTRRDSAPIDACVELAMKYRSLVSDRTLPPEGTSREDSPVDAH